ncbi:MAG: ROK family protein [Clostridiales bacterium]|nr:ROK family protein [Clostridiales bacterium]
MNIFDRFAYSPTQKWLLSIIYAGNSLTRQMLADISGMSALTVVKAVSVFIDDGVLVEGGKLSSKGGRKPNMLMLRADLAYVICVDIGASATRIGLVSIGGEVVDKIEDDHFGGSFPTQATSKESLKDMLKEIRRKWDAYEILGMNICITGLVDNDQTIVHCPHMQGYNGENLVDYLGRYFDMPIMMNTSARTMALGEQYFGAGRGVENQVYISVGFSISAGLILNGALFMGAGGFAGEVGHIGVSPNGHICACGNEGCLEEHATIPVIMRRIREKLSQPNVFSIAKSAGSDLAGLSVRDARDALEKGDKVVFSVLAEIGAELGEVVSDITNTINPELILLGGGAIETFGILVEEIAHTVRSRALIPNQGGLRVEKGHNGFDSALIGGPVQIVQALLK